MSRSTFPLTKVSVLTIITSLCLTARSQPVFADDRVNLCPNPGFELLNPTGDNFPEPCWARQSVGDPAFSRSLTRI